MFYTVSLQHASRTTLHEFSLCAVILPSVVSPALSHFGLLFNMHVGVAHCTHSRHTGTSPLYNQATLDRLITHLRRFHKDQSHPEHLHSVRIEINERLGNVQSGLLQESYLARDIEAPLPPPISGIPISEVFQCLHPACDYRTPGVSHLYAHQRKEHNRTRDGEDKPTGKPYKMIWAQSIGLNPSTWCVVARKATNPLVPKVDRFPKFTSVMRPLISMSRPKVKDALANLNNGVRQMSDFHSQIGWDTQLETVGLLDLARLGFPKPLDTDAPWITYLYRHADKVWDGWAKTLSRNMGVPFRKLLKGESAHSGRSEFQALQPDSRRIYAKTFRRIILVTLRYTSHCLAEPSGNRHDWQIEAPVHKQFLCLRDRFSAVDSAPSRLVPWAEMLVPQQEEISDCIHLWFDTLVKTAYQIKDLWHDPLQWFMLSSTVQSHASDSDRPKDLFFSEEDGDQAAIADNLDAAELADESDVVQLIAPNHYSGVFAHLQYSIRLLLWTQACEIYDSITCNDSEAQILEQYCHADNAQYIFAWVRRALCTARMARRDLPPRLTMGYSASQFYISIGRISVTQQRLTVAAGRIVTRLSEFLEEELLLGLGTSLVDQDSNLPVADTLRRETLGYSFMTDTGNEFYEKHAEVLQAIASSPPLQKKFYGTLADGTVFLDRQRMLRYLDHQKTFLGLLFTALHLACAVPSRAAEYNTLLLSETGDRHRSLYHDPNGLFLIFRYTKQTAVFGFGQPVPKYVGNRVGAILIRYLTFALPTARAFAQKLRLDDGLVGHSPSDALSTHLFATHTGILPGHFLTSRFRHVMQTVGDLPLSMSDYRHVCIAFARKYISPELSDMSTVPELIELAANHTARTGRELYAHHQEEPENGMAERLLQQHLICTAWQGWIGLGPKFNPKKMNDLPASGSPDARRLAQQLAAVDGNVKQTPPADLALALTFAIECLEQEVRQALFRATAQVTSGPPPLAQKVSLSGVTDPCLVGGLQAALGDDRARFKDPSMLRTLDVILHRGQDVLAIYPTGSGKSTLIWLPSLLSEGVTVMISLHQRLTEDILPTAARTGLNVVRYSADLTIGACPRLVYVAVENITSDHFCEFIKSLHAAKMLDRIVIDEVHTVLLQVNFRQKLRALLHLKAKLNLKGVPSLWLTATLPPHWEPILARWLDTTINDVYVVRASSNRPNLRYLQVDDKTLSSSANITTDAWNKVVVAFIARELDGCLTGDNDDPTRIIVYIPYVKDMVDVHAAFLKHAGAIWPSELYHAQLPIEEKNKSFANWMTGVSKVMFATSALGQGVDCPHVRKVFFVGNPFNVVDFAQQAGRAGRDGSPADIYMIPPLRSRDPFVPNAADKDPSLTDLERSLLKGLESVFYESGPLSPYQQVYKIFCKPRDCIRRQLTTLLDSISSSCFTGGPGTELCSLCESELDEARNPRDPSHPFRLVQDRRLVQARSTVIGPGIRSGPAEPTASTPAPVVTAPLPAPTLKSSEPVRRFKPLFPAPSPIATGSTRRGRTVIKIEETAPAPTRRLNSPSSPIVIDSSSPEPEARPVTRRPAPKKRSHHPPFVQSSLASADPPVQSSLAIKKTGKSVAQKRFLAHPAFEAERPGHAVDSVAGETVDDQPRLPGLSFLGERTPPPPSEPGVSKNFGIAPARPSPVDSVSVKSSSYGACPSFWNQVAFPEETQAGKPLSFQEALPSTGGSLLSSSVPPHDRPPVPMSSVVMQPFPLPPQINPIGRNHELVDRFLDRLYAAWLKSLHQGIHDRRDSQLIPCGVCFVAKRGQDFWHTDGELACPTRPSSSCFKCLRQGHQRSACPQTTLPRRFQFQGGRCFRCGERPFTRLCPLQSFVPDIIHTIALRDDWIRLIGQHHHIGQVASRGRAVDFDLLREWFFEPRQHYGHVPHFFEFWLEWLIRPEEVQRLLNSTE